MNRIARVPVLTAALVGLLVSMTGCKKLEARDQLNKGVEAYKSAQYDQAIDHFQNAVNLDPTYPMTRIFLATAYSQQVVPNLDTPANKKNADLAVQNYQQVLQDHPGDPTATKGIASVYYNIGKTDLAKQWQEKVIAADPNDPEAPYTIGAIDWNAAFKNAVKILAETNLQDDSKGNVKMSKAQCSEIKQQNTPLVTEGIDNLKKAVQIRPSYDDAMTYLQLMYRRKADVDCGDAAAQKDDLAQVDFWTNKMMATRKANEIEKEKQQNKGGIVLSNQ